MKIADVVLAGADITAVTIPPRTPRALHLQPPRPDHPITGVTTGRIKRRPVLGGLINEYERTA
ncbi:hypothetical protein FDG2_5110 [Candidatus Protofrankia californiensis]|uniref:Uncharacterized protein n=1 Tax=Candidatus Protofrankia californiensis TaxID=1839754 RepID=A0A1C3PAY6_9ACTN|nr:hypothetical protein FDG2_5110 [Candidatus Protofrankia californiensis]